MWIGKNIYVELDRTHCYIEKFNVALSLCGVLEVTLYFSEDFLETAIRESVVAKVPQPLGQKSNLWSFVPKQRHRLCLRHFLHLLLVNLPLLASLEKKLTYKELNCFFRVEDKDSLERGNLVDKATGYIFTLLQRAIILPAVKAFPYFWK